MRALVTGIAGFAGGHLVDYLLDHTDLEIIGTIYRRQPARPIPANRMHLERLDLREAAAVAEILTRWKPDYILHLAAQSFVPISWEHPWPTFEQNVLTQINMFKGVLAAGIDARVLVVGSGEEYGVIRPEDLPLNEETPLRPYSPYGVSKVAQDLLGWQYYRSHDIHTVRVRPFNHIGPGQNEMFVTSSFAKQVAMIESGRQRQAMRHGNLDAERDFTDVRDVVRAYWLALNHGEPGAVYNVGTGQAISIKEVLDTYIALAHTPIPTEPDPHLMRPSDIPRIVCDPTRLKEATGWSPRYSCQETLAAILDDWRHRVR